jgi:hypothetical protein
MGDAFSRGLISVFVSRSNRGDAPGFEWQPQRKIETPVCTVRRLPVWRWGARMGVTSEAKSYGTIRPVADTALIRRRLQIPAIFLVDSTRFAGCRRVLFA